MKKKKSIKKQPTGIVAGIGWYKNEETYLRLLEVSDDRAELDDTYADWLKNVQNAYDNFAGKKEYDVVKIEVDIDELVAFCRKANRTIDGESRAEFIAKKTTERFGGN